MSECYICIRLQQFDACKKQADYQPHLRCEGWLTHVIDKVSNGFVVALKKYFTLWITGGDCEPTSMLKTAALALV
jgi:hypothetical protein